MSCALNFSLVRAVHDMYFEEKVVFNNSHKHATPISVF